MQLHRIDASIRHEGSASRELGDLVERHWTEHHPRGTVRRREIGTEPLPSDAWGHAVVAGATAPEARTAPQRAAVDLAARLVDVLVAADAVLLTVPLYNFGVSQHVKAWIDLVQTDPRSAGGSIRFLEGTPLVLVTVRGGAYGAGTPREGWDHSTTYLTRILGEVWGADVRLVEREFTLVGVNPALDAFSDTARQMHDDATTSARTAGTDLARAIGSSAA
jgi:FMN-dependent NADH-azoreductase